MDPDGKDPISVPRRLKDELFLIGNISHQICGNQLPTLRQVLQVYFFNTRHSSMKKTDSIKLTIEEVMLFWKKSGIPTQDPHNAGRKLDRIVTQYNELIKSAGQPYNEERERKFSDNLKKLFDISKSDAQIELNAEQAAFLADQRSEKREKFICNFPPEFPTSHSKGRESTEDLSDPSTSMEIEQVDTEIELVGADDSPSDNLLEDEDTTDEVVGLLDNLSPPSQGNAAEISESSEDKCQSQKSSKSYRGQGRNYVKKGIRGTINVVDDELAQTFDYCKISHRDACRILAAFENSLSHQIGHIVLNKNSMSRIRAEMRTKKAEKLKTVFGSSGLDGVQILWDGKLMFDAALDKQVDKLPIVAVHRGTSKIINVPILENSKGVTQANAISDTLVDWDLEESTEVITCDTTAANLGHKTGAAVILERLLRKDLLWFPCRHHIYELILKIVFETKFPGTSGPNVPMFAKFRDSWNTMDQTRFRIPNSTEIPEVLVADIDKLAKTMNDYLNTHTPRDDYRELLGLGLIFLGKPSGDQTVKFRKPGAFHHARWMAKAIYVLKIYLFRDEFPLTEEEIEALRQLCLFIVFVYIESWFEAPVTTGAPNNDLKFLQKLHKYSTIDKEVADKALKKISGHLWYLSPQSCALAFFDPNVSSETKVRMVKRLEFQANEDLLPPKRVYIKDENEIKNLHKMDLDQFINADSLNFFQRFKLSTAFLACPPDSWSSDVDYLRNSEIVEGLVVVNDAAERAVKLTQEYNNTLTKDKTQEQHLIQGAEAYRSEKPDANKQTLTKKFRSM